MTVRSRRLGRITLAGDGNYYTLYTVPSDRTLIIRSMSLWNAGASASGAITLGLEVSNTLTVILGFYGSLTSASYVSSSQWMVANPGDELVGRNASGGTVGWEVYGSLLFGAPQ